MGNIVTGQSGYVRLTPEERAFYDMILIRAISVDIGTPYLRAQIVNLHPVAVNDAPAGFTFAVDKRGRVYINFAEVMQKDAAWGAGGLIHECYHLLLAHFDRRQQHHDVDDFWAWATDMEINQNLPEPSKQSMAGQIYFPSSFNFPDGLKAEDYYDLLVEEAKKQQKSQGGQQGSPNDDDDDDSQQGNGQDGEDGDSADEGGNGSDGTDSSEGGDQSGNGQPKQGKGNGGRGTINKDGIGKEHGKSGFKTPHKNQLDDCGSAQTGKNNSHNEASSKDAPERSGMDHEYTRNEVAKAIKAMQERKDSMPGGSKPGTIPEFMRQWAEQVLMPPKVRWQSVFRGMYAQTQRRAKMGRTHTNPLRPARIQPVDEIMFPKRKAHRINVGIAFDSSGSNVEDLKYILGEVHEIIRRGGVDKVYAFSVDASVKDVKQIRRVAEVDFTGGGGTDMRIAFTKLSEMKVDVGIILTDCETPWPDVQPEGKTQFIVAGMISRDSAREAFEQVPDFIRKVEIDLEDVANRGRKRY